MRAFVSLAAFALGLCFVSAQSRPVASQPAPIAPPPAVQPEESTDQPAPPMHIALRIVGSHVVNPGGYRLGRVEEVLINRTNGVIDYAVLAPSFPTNDSRLVPLPWSILRYAWDQSRAGGPAGANQIFVASLGPEQLAKAPTLDRNRTTGIDPALAAANSYFGAGVGGTGSGSGTVTGTGSSQPAVVSPGRAPATVVGPGVTDETATSGSPGQQPFFVPSGIGGFTFVTTNGVGQFPTNASPTNLTGALPAITNAPNPPATNGIVFQPGSGPPFAPFTGTAPPTNVTTQPPGPSGPSAGLGPPGERSQGTPRTPVRTPQTSQPGAAPAPAPTR